MPEMPEVETIRRDLARVLRGKVIAQVQVRKAKIVRGSARALERELVGQSIVGIERRGKLLIFRLSGGKYVLVHLKMTGQLIYQTPRRVIAGGHPWPWFDELPNKYSHVIVDFEDGTTLYFNDQRQFGFWRLVDEEELARVLSGYGVEVLDEAFTRDYLAEVLKGRKTALKNVLLDQTRIAGLGNIYVDESCFRAGVRPTRRADRVTGAEVGKLYRAIRQVVQKAVAERGTTFGDYRDGKGEEGNYVRLLKVYGRGGERCKKCKQAEIVKTKVNGRGTTYCPECQI